MVCDSPGSSASYRWLELNHRLHVQHGPIDLIIEVDGEPAERELAFKQVVAFTNHVLNDLVAVLPMLRTPVHELSQTRFESPVAQHMLCSVLLFSGCFVTPMAAVAGAVADQTLQAITSHRQLQRAFVNNGGDIALHVASPAAYSMGICDDPVTGSHAAKVHIDSHSPIRGVASSGWKGRSHSLGIADVVTVLASSAAIADTAATLIANQVDLPGCEKITRVAANELAPDSDLEHRLVTIDVLPLTTDEKQQALARAQVYAQGLVEQGLIQSAFLCLQGEQMIVDNTPSDLSLEKPTQPIPRRHIA